MHTEVLSCWLFSLNQLSMHAGMHTDASFVLQNSAQHNMHSPCSTLNCSAAVSQRSCIALQFNTSLLY